jgi:hypothetical protein
MTKSTQDMLLDQLEKESDEVFRLIDQLHIEMENAPVEKREAYWERFLELMRRHADIGKKLVLACAEPDTPQ